MFTIKRLYISTVNFENHIKNIILFFLINDTWQISFFAVEFTKAYKIEKTKFTSTEENKI